MTQPLFTRNQAIEVADSLLSSLSRHELAPFGQALHPEVTWHSDANEDQQVQGRDAVVGILGRYVEAFSDLSAIPDFAKAAFENNELAFEMTVEGTNDGVLPGVGVTGRRFRMNAAALAIFDDSGQITELRTYWNCSVALSQLGIRAYARPGPRPRQASGSSPALQLAN